MNRWFSKYLSFFTLIPVSVLLIFITIDVFRAYHALDQANKTIADAELVLVTNQLVHEMQKERGMSAGFLGSKGNKFSTEIVSQRKLTDNEIKNLRNFMKMADFPEATSTIIKQLFNQLEQLQTVRKKVDSQSISLAETLLYYTNNNVVILDLNGFLAAELEESTSSERFLTLYNIAYAKEQAGIERAVLSNVFAKDSFTPALFKRFVELATKQDTYFKSTSMVATPEYKEVVKQFLTSKESREVEKFRDIAANSDGAFGVDANSWFSAATERINKLKITERVLLDSTIDYAEDKVITRRLVIIFEVILLVVLIAITYASFGTIRLRAQQSREIERYMSKVNSENDLTDSVAIVSEDDLGKIAKLINVTFEHIKEDFISFQGNAQQIVKATLQAASATDQSKANLVKLQLDISSIASASEEMSANVESVMENMQIASNGAQEASKETINGENAVSISMQGINRTAEEVGLVGETITELNERVSDILGMVDVIKAVAEQTNLLALNAAIEAARAGEQGRGFAVVADEVRSLAQRTQDSTQEISNVVDVLQNSSKKAFSSIESGNQQANDAVENAQQISKVLKKIVEDIKSVDDVTSVIATATQEQSSAIHSINVNVSSIDDQAKENVIGAEELSAASVQLSKIAHDMEERIEKYKVV
ncbi:methyl-accepting chemotaxis protein [Glaciecola petra]|uniref:Methyl-accepting chemotaxis protein n=1 Tax=Glaciecola petra TaxID=3075602 RepID=A0ABU2ZM51_9ALTE|nr:methyl-accepting chemotaxis protein [Aestuariibacter sp. P117]MDT0593321.1 methyl-accepting chemotaxis protein [Aestuariibacter sp. P117]